MKTIFKSLLLRLLGCGMIAASLAGCEKFLDAKPTGTLVVPSTLKDAQALLDIETGINSGGTSSPEACADNYYIKDAAYNSLTVDESRRMYIWSGNDIFADATNDWGAVYKAVNIANTALDVLEDISETAANGVEYRNVKGQALFLRGEMFHKAIVIWAQAYDDRTASSLPGIPLRLNANFLEKSSRASVAESYDRILSDLKRSVGLLPAAGLHPIRASKASAYGELARVYLDMRKYNEAGLYADSCLQLRSGLLDYNTVKVTSTYSFTAYNVEVIHDYKLTTANSLTVANARVDTNFYRSYAADDLRKALFYQLNADGGYTFKGSYAGGVVNFAGVTTAEMYLVKAECLAREGKVSDALKVLGDLQVKRFKTGKFVAPSATTAAQALDLVLADRRKELAWRNSRWSDIKRLNMDGAGIVLTRKILGQTYTLPPNDKRYALPIPEDIIDVSGMQQNP